MVYVGATFLYFVGMWTGGGQATLGMRVFNLRVGNAVDGQPLTMSAGHRALAGARAVDQLRGGPPRTDEHAGLACSGLLWFLVLLISTA